MALSGFKQFYGKEGEYVPPAMLFDWVRDHPMPDGRMIPVLIWGSKGTGKTQQIKAYCAERGLDMRSYHPAHDTNGQDILGQPKTDPKTGTVTYALPDWLPTEPGNGGVWFIDEINRAQQAVLAGLMEPLGEGTIAQSNWKIPEGWMIIAAANPTETGYLVEEIDEAMVDRMLHYSPGWEAPVWGHWASGSEIDPDIINFAFQRADLIPATSSLGQTQVPHEIEGKLGPTPRSLTYFASLYQPGMPEGLLRVVSQGLLGKEAGDAFVDMVRSPEKPLSGSEILANPAVDDSGNKEYLYDEKLISWRDNLTEKNNYLQASVQHLVVELLNIGQYVPADPEPGIDYQNDVRQNVVAQRAGRFLAMLPSRTKDEAYQMIERSAPAWSGVIAESIDIWLPTLAQSGKIIGSAPPASIKEMVESLPESDLPLEIGPGDQSI